MRQLLNSRNGKVKLIALLLGAMLIGGAAGGVLVKKAVSKHDKQAAADDNAESSESGEESSGKQKEKPPAWGPEIVTLGEFLLNVDSASGLRYVKCEIAIQAVGYDKHSKKKKGHGEKSESPLTPEQEAWAKDTVIRVFAETPFEQLRTSKGREELRSKLAKALNEVLQSVRVKQVLFTSFVMQ